MKNILRPFTVALIMAAVVAALGVPPASAALQSWTVKVLRVNDGDTFEVDSNGDRRTDYTVRMVGINTPEGHWDNGVWRKGEYDYTLSCFSKPAYTRLRNLIEGKRVILKATSFDSNANLGRKLRYVHRISDGMDLSKLMLDEGRAVAYPNKIEPGRNGTYIRAARAAKAAKRGIWRPAACEYGPHQNAPLKVRVRWLVDAEKRGLNEEYVRIENYKYGTDMPIGNWTLRDSSALYYRFPRSAVIPANGSVTVHSGQVPANRVNGWGSPNRHYYWNLSRSAWPQERIDLHRSQTTGNRDNLTPLGDGAYLYDKHLDLRGSMTWPCITSTNATCKDEALGAKVSLGVKLMATGDPINNEMVSVTNTNPLGGADVDISGFMLDAWPYNYEIARGTNLAPGETLRVHSGSDPGSQTTTLNQFWGLPKNIFWFPDYVDLRRMEGHVVERLKWTSKCGNHPICGDFR